MEGGSRGDVKAAFERDGYLVFDPRIPVETIDGAVAEANRGFEQPARRLRLPFGGKRDEDEAPAAGERFHDAWAKSKNVRDIALAPTVLDLLRQLYGREPKPFQTLNFRFGSQQQPHSDAFHFNTQPRGYMCGVWVALEDVDMDSGPLVYYPGSHQLPELSPRDVGIRVEAGKGPATDLDYHVAYEPYVRSLIEREGFEPRYGTIRKGQAILWATNLVHGGTEVRDPNRTRHSQVTHYFFEGTRLWTPLSSTEEHTAWREAPQIA
jgi:ectoine hydroxylase-related dioxygenase (phytanoyl-CoA dioxygenase family)